MRLLPKNEIVELPGTVEVDMLQAEPTSRRTLPVDPASGLSLRGADIESHTAWTRPIRSRGAISLLASGEEQMPIDEDGETDWQQLQPLSNIGAGHRDGG